MVKSFKKNHQPNKQKSELGEMKLLPKHLEKLKICCVGLPQHQRQSQKAHHHYLAELLIVRRKHGLRHFQVKKQLQYTAGKHFDLLILSFGWKIKEFRFNG